MVAVVMEGRWEERWGLVVVEDWRAVVVVVKLLRYRVPATVSHWH